MSIVTPAASRSFVAKARLPGRSARSRTRSGGMANTPPLPMKASEAQTRVVGRGLVIADTQVPVQTRQDLVNGTLFAQQPPR